MKFFEKDPNLEYKKTFFFLGGGGGRGSRVSQLFNKESK